MTVAIQAYVGNTTMPLGEGSERGWYESRSHDQACWGMPCCNFDIELYSESALCMHIPYRRTPIGVSNPAILTKIFLVFHIPTNFSPLNPASRTCTVFSERVTVNDFPYLNTNIRFLFIHTVLHLSLWYSWLNTVQHAVSFLLFVCCCRASCLAALWL